MARLGINYQDVEEAATALQTGGHNPTVDRVREYLGSGSKSTIAPLLKQWREQNSQERNLPEQLQKAVAALYNTLQAEADEKIAQAEDANNKALEELKQQRDLLEQQAMAGIEKITELETALSEEQKHSEEKTKRIQALETTATESAAQLEQKELQLKDKQQALLSQQQQNKHLTESFDHYQQQVALQREQDRADFADAKQQFELQLSQALQQQQQLNTEVQQAVTEQNRLTEENKARRSHFEALEKTLADQATLTKELKDEKMSLLARLSEEKQKTIELEASAKIHNQHAKQLEAQIEKLDSQSSNNLKMQEQLQSLLASQQETILSLQRQLEKQTKQK